MKAIWGDRETKTKSKFHWIEICVRLRNWKTQSIDEFFYSNVQVSYNLHSCTTVWLIARTMYFFSDHIQFDHSLYIDIYISIVFLCVCVWDLRNKPICSWWLREIITFVKSRLFFVVSVCYIKRRQMQMFFNICQLATAWSILVFIGN